MILHTREKELVVSSFSLSFIHFFYKQEKSEDHNDWKDGGEEQTGFQIASYGVSDRSNHGRTYRSAQISG